MAMSPEANQIRVESRTVEPAREGGWCPECGEPHEHKVTCGKQEIPLTVPAPDITLGTIWAIVQDTAGRVRRIEAALKRRGLA